MYVSVNVCTKKGSTGRCFIISRICIYLGSVIVFTTFNALPVMPFTLPVIRASKNESPRFQLKLTFSKLV